MPKPQPNPLLQNPNWAWIWFAYTGFLFIDPFFYHSVLCWAVTFAAFFTFAGIYALYVHLFDSHSPLRFWTIAATFVLGLIVFPINQGASCFFIYSAAFLPFNIKSLRRIAAVFIAEIVIVLVEGSIFHARSGPLHISWANTVIAIFLMGMIGGVNIFFAMQKRADCQLREALQENLALAAVAERERIARDLHDVLGHTLSVIVLKSELAHRLLEADIPNAPRAANEIADVERIARTALADVREAIGGYRARGLAAEIEAARLTLDAAGVTLVLDSPAAGVTLVLDSPAAGVTLVSDSPAAGATLVSDSPAAGVTLPLDRGATAAANLTAPEETALALALREAVTNIVRHSAATTCRLRFVTEANQRRLIIEDNGASSQPTPIREGNGIRGMRQRIESLGGRLSLQHDQGTRLLIELPLHPEAL